MSDLDKTAGIRAMTETVARTEAGKVRGRIDRDIVRFQGVPYAAPPVGERRFAAPQPHAPWHGVRDATVPGPNAPQKLRPFPALDMSPLLGSGWIAGDDFLTAAIWTPDIDAAGLPVLLFIHGGAYVAGCNDVPATDGAAFARSGVVCISINYRLGIEGFLPIEGAPTNLGLRDQLAAMRWVRDNAAAFGGDPDNVTLCGESAGGMSIANLIASPLAKGLFRRAIIQSGHGSMTRSIEITQRLTRKIAELLDITPNVDGFRSASAEACLQALESVQQATADIDLRDGRGFDPAFGLTRFLPVHGDDVLPQPPIDALSNGAGADVDILIGTNLDEMNLYFVPTGAIDTIGWRDAWRTLGKSHPHPWRPLAAGWIGARQRTAGEALSAAMSDLAFRDPARRYAAAHRGRTHFYEFDWQSQAFDGRLGACHAIDLPFVFDTIDSCAGPKGILGEQRPHALARRMHQLWVDYASGIIPPWPASGRHIPSVFSIERWSI